MGFSSNILLTIFLLTNLVIAKLREENLALKTRLRQPCDSYKRDNSMLNDGVVDSDSYAIFEQTCNTSLLFIELELKKLAIISHVVIYPGSCGDCQGWDFFEILMKEEMSEVWRKCSSHAGSYLKRQMRVNCVRDSPSNLLILRPNQFIDVSNVSIAISEIEVFEHQRYYFGCFEQFDSDVSIVTQSLTRCTKSCYDFSRVIFSTLKENKCLCSKRRPRKKVNCKNGKEYSVYIVRLPWIYYMGCYYPQEEIGWKTQSSSEMTISKCVVFCSQNYKPYAYLKNSAVCLCGSVLPINVADFGKCHMTCSGEEDICGGRDAASVYSGCNEQFYSSNCLELYHCKDDNFDKFGRCLTRCTDGYKGSYCVELLNDTEASDEYKPLSKKSEAILFSVIVICSLVIMILLLGIFRKKYMVTHSKRVVVAPTIELSEYQLSSKVLQLFMHKAKSATEANFASRKSSKSQKVKDDQKSEVTK